MLGPGHLLGPGRRGWIGGPAVRRAGRRYLTGRRYRTGGRYRTMRGGVGGGPGVAVGGVVAGRGLLVSGAHCLWTSHLGAVANPQASGCCGGTDMTHPFPG